MSKLTLEALKERAEALTSTDLLSSISGGTENSCHTDPPPSRDKEIMQDIYDGITWPRPW